MDTIGLVGEGIAADAVRAGLEGAGRSVRRLSVEAIGEVDLGIVVGRVGDERFGRAHRASRRATLPWIAVEVGGVGGVPIEGVAAAVSAFPTPTPCYACLGARVEANAPTEAEPGSVVDHDVRLAGAVAAWTAERTLDGDGRTVAGLLVEIPHVERRLLPVPGCGGCGDESTRRWGTVERPWHVREDDRDREVDLDRDRELEASIERAEIGIDPRVGIISEVGEVGSYPAPYYLARSAETEGFSDASAASEAAGVDAEWRRAFMRAVGEAYERYAAGVYRVGELEVATVDEIDRPIRPEAVVSHEHPGPDEAIPWVDGVALGDDQRVSIPAELVLFPPPERRFGPAITTGLGLGASLPSAIVSGLTEVIERDATMLAWYSTYEPLGVVVEDPTFEGLRRRAESEGLAVETVAVTQDVDLPVIVVGLHRPDDWPRFAVGSSADLDPVVAARGALAEAVQNWMELREMGPDRADEAGAWIGRYAAAPEPATSFLEATGRVAIEDLRPTEAEAGVGALLERLSAVDLEAYACRLTTLDLERMGFEAVRILVPGMQPLFTSEPVFGERAKEVPRSLGFLSQPERAPHPFP